MNILVDTSVWSLALRRRKQGVASPLVARLAELIQDGRAVLIGAVRQELLAGVRSEDQFQRLRNHLSAFPDVALDTEDYEVAASFSNLCRASGVQGSSVDFLICAVSIRRELGLFTTDKDFDHYARLIPLKLLPV